MVIAREQLAGYLGQEPSRVHLEGPSVHLPSDQATPFGLLLNELATNAAKYGALSRPGGKVTIAWEAIQADRGQRLGLCGPRWVDHGSTDRRQMGSAAT